MGHRNMICTAQMIGLEMDQQGQSYLHPCPEPCIIYGGLLNMPPPDMQTMITAPSNTSNLDAHHATERYDNPLFYGMPQYHGIQHHPHHVSNLDLGVATASNLYMPYMNPSPGIPLSHSDHLSSSSNYGVIGGPADEYGMNSHLMDNARGSFKRKNAEVNPGHFQFFNLPASSSSSVATMNSRHPDGVVPMEAASFTRSQYRGNSAPSIREMGLHRSVQNRSGVSGLDAILAHNPNHFIQGSYIGQPFAPAAPLWVDRQLSSNSTDASAAAWTQNPTTPFMHGNNMNGGTAENGNMAPQQYHETPSNRSSTSFLHPSTHLQHHSFHQMHPPIQGARGQNINVLPQVPPAPYRVPTNYALQSTMSPPDGFDRHGGSVLPTGLRMHRPHREGAVPEASVRQHNPPQLRVLPTDGVALLEFPPDYYEVDNYVDDHRDMRLDIEDMSYEELLALGEWIGNVSTGLSEETIRSRLKTRTYLLSPASINLEEAACMDLEPESCIICQDDYNSREKIATLECGHEYHADCLKKWLRVKNVCPICKSEALTTKDV